MASLGEFDLIAKYFAPLTGPEGLGLLDDAALLLPPDGAELVMTADALVAGVHFRHDDPADLIARKALRVNLSDLAAKGAEPLGYLLTTAWPQNTAEDYIRLFSAGLGVDQVEFNIRLFGGDTVTTSGPTCLSITAVGHVPKGQMIRRKGSGIGDLVYVTGTVGDGALGLDHPEIGALNDRYLLPQPRLAIGRGLRGIASAAMDISDGLIADAGHLASASGVCIEINVDWVPLSRAAQELIDHDSSRLGRALCGGDDYELLFTVPSALPIKNATCIGQVTQGQGVKLLRGGQKVTALELGWGLGFGGWQHRLAT